MTFVERHIVITGASSGLGKCIANELASQSHRDIQPFTNIHNWSLDQGVDVSDWKSVKTADTELRKVTGDIDILINCAGVNHLDFLVDMEEAAWDKVLDTNAKGIFLVTQALIPYLLRTKGAIVNIVSNASNIPMTSSLAYNASKAAAEIMTRQMARELGPRFGITVFGVSPNKLVGTGMSTYIEERVCTVRGWTPQRAKEYQLAALPAGEETPPEVLAEFIAFLLSSKERHKYLQGCVIPYGGPV